MLNRHAALFGGALVATLLLSPAQNQDGHGVPEFIRSAKAAVSIAFSLEQLVDESAQAVVAVPTHRRHQWERLAGSRRIVTYTRVEIRETVFDRKTTTPSKAAKKVVWIRTLGGQVGRIGQHVGGEAQLKLGEENLLFLTRSKLGVTLITGMAQGQYPVERAKLDTSSPKESATPAPARLRLSRSMGTILPRRKSNVPAIKRLGGVELSEAIRSIREVKRARDAAKQTK